MSQEEEPLLFTIECVSSDDEAGKNDYDISKGIQGYKKLHEEKKEKIEKELAVEAIERNEDGIRVIKPLDIEKLKQEEEKRGFIFVSVPHEMKDYQRVGKVRRYFEQFGVVEKIQSQYEMFKKSNYGKKRLVGFYLEFQSKDLAKRIALTVHGKALSRKDSRTLSVKYIPDFKWTDLNTDDDKKKMYSQLLKAEAEKELSLIKQFSKQKKQKTKKVFNGVVQKSFHSYQNNTDQDYHLEFVNMFGKKGKKKPH